MYNKQILIKTLSYNVNPQQSFTGKFSCHQIFKIFTSLLRHKSVAMLYLSSSPCGSFAKIFFAQLFEIFFLQKFRDKKTSWYTVNLNQTTLTSIPSMELTL